MARQLGIGRNGFGSRAALAHDQLIVADPDRLLLAQLLEGQGAHDGRPMVSLVLAVKAGDELGSLGGDRLFGTGVVVGLFVVDHSQRRGRTRRRYLDAHRIARACRPGVGHQFLEMGWFLKRWAA